MKNLGYLLNSSAKLIKYQLNKRLEEENFTATQWAVIKDLQMLEEQKAHDNQYMSVSIAGRLDMDKPTISGVVKRLLEKGFIQKLPHPTDKRAHILQLTEQTKEILPTLEKKSEETISVALQGFSEKEISELTSYLVRINMNLKD
ncbi:MarR family winged helix-turn-helix transcriptional regulator [Cytobacillus sp. FJAT-54145]|uniref:MarR family winged helix-turn-helix transcriptional regulator n=1 Tax=Cytobacillus spartinae TaxID=3299023 RepID=A0ABW6KDP1_9BACI